MANPYEAERLQILEMIENGSISAEEGVRLLETLPNSDDTPPRVEAISTLEEDEVPSEAEVEVLDSEPPSSIPPEMTKRRGWWIYPFWGGVGIAILGSALMFAALELGGLGFWFFCATLPFLFGLGVIALSWYSRTATWLHLRIRQEPNEWPSHIALSFPIPIRPTAWFLRTFRRWIPNMDQTGLDEVIMALGANATPENPLYVEVEDEEDGERVEIYIG